MDSNQRRIDLLSKELIWDEIKPWMSISVSNTSSPPKSMRALWCLFWVGWLGFGGSNILACQMEQWLKPLNTSHISPSGQEPIESVFANSEVRSCWPMCTTAARPEWGKEKTCCPFGGSRIAVCCSFYCENVIECCYSNFSTYLFSRSHTVFHFPGLLLWYCRVSLLLNLEPHTSPCAQPRLLQNRWETNNNWKHLLGKSVHNFTPFTADTEAHREHESQSAVARVLSENSLEIDFCLASRLY